jgi:hypothetical protein
MMLAMYIVITYYFQPCSSHYSTIVYNTAVSHPSVYPNSPNSARIPNLLAATLAARFNLRVDALSNNSANR